jgi:hypothetical protein
MLNNSTPTVAQQKPVTAARASWLQSRKIKRDVSKMCLRPLLRWTPLQKPADGFSIVLGVPWALRHLLEVNLRFVAATDIADLKQAIIVFDRVRQSGADQVISNIIATFPHLPLEFHFQPPLAGRAVAVVNQSKFYACLNWVTGLKHCCTRYAVLHDFDLYPVTPSLFTSIVETMRRNQLRFCGVEHTHFDGLTDADALIGTWELGVDVEWLREHFQPVDCFHSVAKVNGRYVDLDGFNEIQAKTPSRALANAITRDVYAHVTNLCSTYLRLMKGQQVQVAWRIPFLWYLESLSGLPDRLTQATRALELATDARVAVGDTVADFGDVHPTCANVLREEVIKMEGALFTKCRPETQVYLKVFAQFLDRVAAENIAAAAQPSNLNCAPE